MREGEGERGRECVCEREGEGEGGRERVCEREREREREGEREKLRKEPRTWSCGCDKHGVSLSMCTFIIDAIAQNNDARPVALRVGPHAEELAAVKRIVVHT